MLNRAFKTSLGSAVLVLAVTNLSQGAVEPLSGRMIAEKMYERAEGDAVRRTLHMELTNKGGKTRKRSAKVYRRHTEGQKETVIRLESPRSVRGMAFLTYDRSDPSKDDEQWLYLPALKKVRRIPASDRGDYFLGTDFSYNDVKEELKFEPTDYVFRYEDSYAVEDKEFHRISGEPSSGAVAKELGYGGFKAIIAAESWMPVDILFLDLKGQPLKQIYVKDVKLVDGIWSPRLIEVENLQTGHRTKFTYSEVIYTNSLPETLFSVRSLRSGRGK